MIYIYTYIYGIKSICLHMPVIVCLCGCLCVNLHKYFEQSQVFILVKETSQEGNYA